ncbi:MAG TPA: thioredoxin domain-containing protein [Bryobacteraceae bacterium]|nr:thioredoxin domain-containing protein [Bryobacteraceae bacterium]
MTRNRMVHVTMKIFAVILLCASQLTWAAPGKGALDKTTFEKYLRHLELFRGDVTFKIDDAQPSKYLPGFSEVLVHLIFNNAEKDELFYISADGQSILRGDVFNLGKSPFQSNLDKLTVTDQPSFGPADAPVTIVEFGDFECPDCKMEAPILRHDLVEAFGGKVRVYFKNFPLESVHPWARAAAITGRCVYQQGQPAFWKFYDWIYENQDQIMVENLNSKVLAWASENGVDAAKLGQCVDTKATEPEVNRSIAEGHALGIGGTPTLFINGRKIGGLMWPDLQLVINKELEYTPPTHASAGR